MEKDEQSMDFSSPNRLLMEEVLHQLTWRISHFFKVLYIPGGCLGFLNHQQDKYFSDSEHGVLANLPSCQARDQFELFFVKSVKQLKKFHEAKKT